MQQSMIQDIAARLRGMRHRLVYARVRTGLDQSGLAEALGVSADDVEAWESGREVPRLYDALKLSAVLDVTCGWLAGEEQS